MAKTMTFKSLAAVLMLAFGFQASYAQVFWTETFSDPTAAVTNWVNGGTNSGANQLAWEWTDDLDAGAYNGPTTTLPTGDTGYFWFDSDGNGAGAHDVRLTGEGNPANCTGKTNVHLRFHTFFRTFSGADIGRIGISLDGTNFTYHNVPEFDNLVAEVGSNFQFYEGPIEVAIPEADGQSQVWIQFRWEGDFEYYWKVDDLELLEPVAAISDVTFQVNTTLISVNPAGMFIAGSFTGLMPVAMTDLGGGVWSYTAPLAEGDYLYRFINGPTGFEDGLPLAACGVANPTLGGFDRALTVGTEDIIIPAVCFNSCAPCVVPCNLDPNAIICDDFETYNVGNVSPQSPHWIPWDLNDGANNIVGSDVVTTFASNGTKSMRVRQDGGGDDQLLQLGNKTTGRYSLTWKYYIPAGKATYFNIQGNQAVPGETFANEVYFRTTGVVDNVAPTPTVSAPFPFDQWFPVKIIVDLDNNIAKLFVNNNLLRAWPFTTNFGAIDFYAADATYLAYVDEVEYIQLPSITYNVDVCDAAIDLTLLFGQPITQTTGIYDNTTATVSPSDPDVDCWGETPGADILNNTMWYTFVGDGQMYHIETVPCNSTNYITGPGDTQMLIYAGDDCNDLTEVACNDDLYNTGVPDWRAGIDIITDPGQNYYMLIDGFDNAGTVATGEFCIEITKVASVLCADGAVGTYTASSDLLCWTGVLADLINVDPSGFVLPNEGIVAGMAWAISAGPLDPTLYPADDPNYLGSFAVLPDVYAPGVPNDNSSFMMAGNIYYFTPVVIGNGDNGGLANFLHNIDISNGCYYVGESVGVAFLPATTPITATIVAGASSANLTPGGGIGALIGDESYYSYIWSNGAITQDLVNVPLGTYTVTVTDACSASATKSITITVTDTKDPASIQSFVISPNPTAGILTLNLALATAADVRIEVLNTLGQTLQSLNVGKLSNLSQNVDLSNMAQGSYFLRLTVDGETAIRRVVVQR